MRIFVIFLVVLFTSLCVYAEDDTRIINKTSTVNSAITATLKSAKVSQPVRLKPLTAVRIKKPLLLKLENIKPITSSAASVKPQGPDPTAILDLTDIIDDTDLLKDLEQVCGWDSHLIIQDSAATHVFYYIPREFLLKRDPDGYRLTVQYNSRAETGQPSVMLTAELEAPHRTGDVGLLKSIMRDALDLSAGDPLEIKALPGVGATADLEALATGLTIAPERIHLNPPAHLKQVFRLTLSLTQDETEEVLAQIARDGILGSLNITVKETALPIPIRIKYETFSGPRIEGFDQWTEGKSVAALENLTDFPLDITAINAYRLHNGVLERVSKNLKPLTIKPGTSKSFKLPAAKKLLGDHLMVTWIALSLDGNCTECIKKVDLNVRKGVGLAPRSTIHLEAIPYLFEEFGLYKLIVHIQSPYFTAEGTTLQQQAIQLTADENENNDLAIFVPTGKGSEPLLYKFKLEAVTETGEARVASEWQDAKKLTQFFGSSHVAVLFDTAAQ